MNLLRDVRLATCYRMRIDSLLGLIDAFDHEVSSSLTPSPPGCGITAATRRSEPFLVSAPRSLRSSSSRSATSVASRVLRGCARGPG